ncbi:MAG: ABC transporter permease [Acidobacteria bacterium]|nr:ABC transporter permease [Acidobacteriota bacterium]
MSPAELVREGFVEMREHLGRTVLQTLGVILGVASVVATLGMTAGQEAARDAYFRSSGGTLLMGVYSQPPAETELTARQRAQTGLKLSDAAEIRRTIPGFDQVVAEISGPHQVRAGATEMTERITAIEPEFQQMRDLEIARGRFFTSYDMATRAPVIVLGSTRARELFGTANPVGKAVSVDNVRYTVIGVMREKVFKWRENSSYNAYEWMNRLMMVPITSYEQRHMKAGDDKIDELNLRLASAESHDEAKKALERLLRARHGVVDYGIWDRKERLDQGEREGRIYNLTFLACGVISLLVGGIVITNIMLASFTERMREVGVRKALGATGPQVFLQFLVESLVVTVLGGTVGLALGIGFTWGITKLLMVQMALTPAMVSAAVGAAGIVGLIFGLYPAVRASRLDPAVALRYE